MKSNEHKTAFLTVPSVEYRDSFLDALAEYQAEGSYSELDLDELKRDFPSYVQGLLDKARESRRGPNTVPEIVLWLVTDREYIGKVIIKHQLKENLLRWGGNIGFDIRPSRRRRGYGKLILRLALPEASKLGLERVLIMCRPGNTGSLRIIESNGGVFEGESEIERPEGMVRMRRYWIDL